MPATQPTKYLIYIFDSVLPDIQKRVNENGIGNVHVADQGRDELTSGLTTMMRAFAKSTNALFCRISKWLKIANTLTFTLTQSVVIRWAFVFLATTLIATSAFATNYLVFPAQGTWTLGTGLESNSASTNGSNPITNSEVRFSVRKNPAGNFTSNGVLCLCLKGDGGSCIRQNSVNYTVGTSTVTFPPLALPFIGDRTYFIQRSDNNQTTCTSLDPLNKSGEMLVRGDIAPPVVTTLTATQSGFGLSGTAQILSPDVSLSAAPRLHFARGSSAGPYNCTKTLAYSQSLQSWSVDKLTGEDANAATGATCASVFSGTGTQTIWVKVEAFNTAGLQAVVGTPTNPISAIVNWTPSVSSVTPLAGVTGQPATVTVTGANLPSTLVMDIAGQSPGCTRQSVSSTQATFYCALSLAGSRLLSVKTDTNANGGTVISQQTFLVNLIGGFVAITVGAMTPDTARLDVPATFNVTGTGLTAGMGFAVDDCELVTEVAGGTATSRSWTCTPRAPGIKAVHVKTAPGGTEISGSFRVRVEHPQRLGDPAARGNPTVGGVTLFNGNFFTQSVDLAVPGKGLSFALTRSYNSYDWQYETDHGGVPADRPWRFNIEMRIGYVPNTGNKRLYVAREDGSGESYFLSGGTWYPIDLGNFSTIRDNGDNTYTVQTRGQLSYTYESPTGLGRLLRVNDRDGNQLSYTYGANGRVTQITDASGRAYTVTYDAFNRISRVTDFTGRYVEYTYLDTISGKIATFRDVRGGLTQYAYKPGTGNLQTITDPRGFNALTISYTVAYGNVAVKALTMAVGRATGGRTCNGSAVFTYCFTYTELPGSAGFRTVVDDPENAAISSVEFDNAGRAAAITDGQGNRRTTAYENIAESTNYAKSALPTARKSPLGVAGSYQTDIGYNLTHGLAESVKNPELETSTTGWNIDPANNLFTPATVTTALNNTSGLGYTPTGRPTRITAAQQFAQGGANGASTRLNWTGGLLTGVIDPLNRAITLTRDTHGNLTETTDPRNPLWKTIRTYDALGRVITVTDARGGITRYTYDAAGNVLTTTQELPGLPSIVNTHTYDANGNLATHLDPRGTLTTYTYDIGNRLTTISRIVSGVTTTRTLGYDNASRVTSVTNENNNTSTRIFDAAGRVSTEALPLSRTTQYTYDADSRLKTVTDPEGRTTTYEYDKVGRVTSVTNTLGLTQRYQYNPEGRLAAFTDARGNTTRYGYDRNGNLTSVTDANNVISTAAYDDATRMVSRTDPRGKTTRYEYDFAGNLTAEIDPINNRWDYTYDENNNLTSVRNPDTRTIDHLYDAQNRRTRTTYNSNNTQVNYTYDANGNLATMVDSVGTTSYQYDEANRLKQFTDPFGNTVTYTFDKAGNRKTMTYPGARVVTYGYDTAERMSTVLDWTNRTATYTYNRADQITRLVHGNATTADYTYDTAGRLTSLINKQPNGTVISSHTHSLDAFGNITQADEILPLQPTLTPRIKRWTVDDANRVLTDSVSGDSFEHDTAGRLIRQVIGGATTGFTYNDLDLLTTLTAPGRTESYRYNGQGHRLERTVNGVATRYLVEPNGVMPNMLVELSGTNTAQRFYVHGSNGILAQIDAAGTFRAFHYAPIGHTLALTDSTASVVDTYAHTPYGISFSGLANSTQNPFRFVGRFGVIDDQNGLVHMRARYYSTIVGKFLAVDRYSGNLSYPQSMNRFAYAMSRPMNAIDATGLVTQAEADEAVAKFTLKVLKKGWYDTLIAGGDELRKRCAEGWEQSTIPQTTNWIDWVGVHVAAPLAVISGCFSGLGAGASAALDTINPLTYIKALVEVSIENESDSADEKRRLSKISTVAFDILDLGVSFYKGRVDEKKLLKAQSNLRNQLKAASPATIKRFKTILSKTRHSAAFSELETLGSALDPIVEIINDLDR